MDIQQFGSTIKQKYPAYKDYSDEEIGKRMLQKYPQYKNQVSVKPEKPAILKLLLNASTNIAQDVGTGIRGKITQPTFNKAQETARQLEQQSIGEQDPARKKALLQEANRLHADVSRQAGDLGKSFSPDIKMNPLLRSLLGAVEIGGTAEIPAATAGIARTGLKVAKIVAHPKQAVGRALEQKVASAGRVPNDLLEKYFGTYNRPNEALIEKVGTARDRGKLLKIIRGEIVNQGSSGGGVVQGPTYRDILNYRIGAGTKGRFGSQAPAEEQLLNRNIQRAYSQILKEGAGTENLDKIYSLLAKAQGTTRKALPYGIGGAVSYALINKLLNKIVYKQ